MEKIRQFLKRPSSLAFLVYTLLSAVSFAVVFWGAWNLDTAFVQPDNATHWSVTEASQWFHRVCSGETRFIPFDLIHVIGGMYFWSELQYALCAYLAGLGMAFFLKGKGASNVARYAAGFGYAFSGYNFTLYSAGHLGWFILFAHIPFAFALLERAVRKGRIRNWILLGAVWAWGGAQQPDIWFIFSVLLAVYGLYLFISTGFKLRVVWGAAIALAVFVAVGLPQFRSAMGESTEGREKQIAQATASAKTEDEKASARYEFCVNWSLPPDEAVEFFVPNVNGTSNDPRVARTRERQYHGRIGMKASNGKWMPYRQHGLFMGFATLVFLVFAFAKGSSKRERIFWTAVSAVFLVFAFGAFTPLYRIVYALPFGDSIRCPVKLVHVVEFSFAVLAGIGIDRILKLRHGGIIAATLIALNVISLVSVDRDYFAIEDVSFYRAQNRAAEKVRESGGKVYVPLASQSGGDMVRGSFGDHDAKLFDAAKDKTPNWVFLVGDELKNNEWQSRIKSGAIVAEGAYRITPTRGIVSCATGAQANALLCKVNGATVVRDEPETTDGVKVALIALSFGSTLAVFAYGMFLLAGDIRVKGARS